MSRRFFDYDPLTGEVEWFHYDDATDQMTVQTEQTVDPLVDQNKRLQNDTPSNWKGDMHRVASIPLNLFWELKKQGVVDDPKRLKAWLNDPNNRYFRTRTGKV